MKKGIVMELHRKYTIIMTKEGSFQKAIPIKGAVIGKEVIFRPLKQKQALFFFFPRRRLSSPLHLLIITCVLLLIAIPFYFLIGEEETYAYVNVDINPSIELKVDSSLNVKSVKPLNKDATEIVDGLTGYQHEHIEVVIEKIMQESVETGLINEGKNMLVGVSYSEGEKDNATIQDHLKKYFKKADPSWKIATFLIPENIREKAKKRNKPMNEVMASTISETDKADVLDDKDREIINTFYNTETEEKPKEINDQHDEKEPNKNKNHQGLNINESDSDKNAVKTENKTVKSKDQKADRKHKENKQSVQKTHKQKSDKQVKKTKMESKQNKHKQSDRGKKEKKKKNHKKDHHKKNKQNHSEYKDKINPKHNNHEKNNKHKEKNKQNNHKQHDNHNKYKNKHNNNSNHKKGHKR